MYYLVITLTILILAFVICKAIKRKRDPISDKRKIDLHYSHNGDDFAATGIKSDFWITKGDRFSFHVIDGQICSFVDKKVSMDEINYGGQADGIHS